MFTSVFYAGLTGLLSGGLLYGVLLVTRCCQSIVMSATGPASAAYATSKGAARIFSRSCVADLGDRFPGIVITDWMPGMLATSMGIPDGLAPEVSAKWGAALALWDDPTLNGSTFEMDREMLPPRSFKRKIKDKLLLRKPPVARIISV